MILLKSNVLYHPFLIHFKTAEWIHLGCLSAPSFGPSMAKNVSSWWYHWKVQRQNLVNKEVVPVRWFSFWLGTVGWSGSWDQVYCHGWIAMICLVSSRTLSEAYPSGFPCRLADWSSSPTARSQRSMFYAYGYEYGILALNSDQSASISSPHFSLFFIPLRLFVVPVILTSPLSCHSCSSLLIRTDYVNVLI